MCVWVLRCVLCVSVCVCECHVVLHVWVRHPVLCARSCDTIASSSTCSCPSENLFCLFLHRCSTLCCFLVRDWTQGSWTCNWAWLRCMKWSRFFTIWLKGVVYFWTLIKHVSSFLLARMPCWAVIQVFLVSDSLSVLFCASPKHGGRVFEDLKIVYFILFCNIFSSGHSFRCNK